MRFDEVLRTFSEFFEREGIRYAVIGGLAMQAWGFSRFTNDIDIVVPRAERDRVLGFASSLGYDPFYVSEGFSNHKHDDRAWGRLDFMYVDETTAAKLFDTAEPRPIVGDAIAPVVRPEHLIAMKLLAVKNAPDHRTGDAMDIDFLYHLPEIDRALVREYFARYGLLDLLHAIERRR
jgi:hypothetical protein